MRVAGEPEHAEKILLRPWSIWSDFPHTPSAARWSVVAIIAVGVGGPVFIALVTGNLSIPHNDAWAYSRVAETFGHGDGFALFGWNRLGLFGQVVALGPLGRWATAQSLAVAIAAVIGLIVTYRLVANSSSRRSGIVACAVIALFPGFGLLATSFMADVPAFTLSVACLALGRRAFDRGSLPLLSVAVAIGVWGATVREQAIAAPASLILAGLVIWPWAHRRVALISLGAVAAALFIAFETWRHGLPNDTPAPTKLVLGRLRLLALQPFCTLAVLVSPVVILVSRPRCWGWLGRLAASAVAVWIAFELRHNARSITLPNYLDPRGAYVAAFVGAPRVLPSAVWLAVRALAVVSAVLLAGEVVTRFRACRLEIQFFLVAVGIGTGYQLAAGQDVFDRYLLAPAAAVLVLLLMPVGPRPEPTTSSRHIAFTAAAAAGLLLACVTAAITLNGLARDAARWDAAEALQQSGMSPMSIDAGLEWLGWHSAEGVGDPGTFNATASTSWYAPMFPDSRICVLVAASPQAAGRLIDRVDYRTYGLFGRAHLYIYDVGDC